MTEPSVHRPSDPSPTSWTLVHKAADGDESARSTFTESYLAVVRGFLEARWHGRRLVTEVEDAAQEVFVEFLRPAGALERIDRSKGNFRALLYTVTRNVARRYESRAVLHRQLRPADTDWMQRLSADEPGQETLFQKSWARAVVGEAKELYRERSREQGKEARRRADLLDQRFGDDRSIQQIASEWDLPAQDVHNAYRKARREFYDCLREVVAYHSPSITDVDTECRDLLDLLR